MKSNLGLHNLDILSQFDFKCFVETVRIIQISFVVSFVDHQIDVTELGK